MWKCFTQTIEISPKCNAEILVDNIEVDSDDSVMTCQNYLDKSALNFTFCFLEEQFTDFYLSFSLLLLPHFVVI